nr:MAG TPA: hypothetical protein [Caudoviricetes sp.]
MPCNLYNNGGYGCGGCTHFVKTNSVTLTDNVLVLNIPQATYSNKEKVCICIAQSIPDVTSADTVAITFGAETAQYILRTKCGNNVHADQLRSRRVYHTNVATDTNAFVVNPCELCKTGFNFPTIS